MPRALIPESRHGLAGESAITAVAQQVEKVCVLLTSPRPEALDRCAGILESAASALAVLRPSIDSIERDPTVLSSARQLQSAVGRARHLLEFADRYHRQWQERLGSIVAGYRPDGNAATVPRTGCISMEG